MNSRKTTKRIKNLDISSKELSRASVIENAIQSLSYRDLLYLSRSINTGDSRYIRKMSNSGRKVYSLIKSTITPTSIRFRSRSNPAAFRARKIPAQTRLPRKPPTRCSKKAVVKIIDDNILSRETDMTREIDTKKLYSKFYTE